MKRKLRNRILAIILIAVIFIGIFPPIKAQATTQGNYNQRTVVVPPQDTPDPHEIYSLDDLKSINNSSEAFYLMKDIEIADNWSPINNFTGAFHGNGHSITFNLNEATGAFPKTQYLGLFASCTDATIKNLYVNGNISLTTGSSMSNPNIYVGGVVASSTNSTLENVHFSGNINIVTSNDNSSWVGGLVGQANNTQILLSSNTAPITAEVKSTIGITKAGGLCGEFSGNIEDCYNTGNVSATAATGSPYAGGLVGNNKGAITLSYNSGKVQSNGSGMSLSDVYVGGIAAVGESGSSITNCAVMSPEINVKIGWVNTGYKFIISKGGSKSDNISINNINGSPTNDSNSRYTQAELKTTAPYKLSFFNAWAIDENINNGYPYHDYNRNAYANKYMTYQVVPEGLKSFVDNNYISISDFKQTSDGFTLCTKPLSEIFKSMGINKIRNGDLDDDGNPKGFDLEELDDWYFFNIGDSYSILKMRNGIGVKKGGENPGTAIPFLELDLNLIHLFHEDIIQQVEETNNEEQLLEHELQLYQAIYNVTTGAVDSEYGYSVPIANYFSALYSKASYMIAEEYIKKIIDTDMDSDGYIIVPREISEEQKLFLLTLAIKYDGIYDVANETIKIENKYRLTSDEKRAILACRTGNQSASNYAAENMLHAKATQILSAFLQGADDELVLENGNTTLIITRALAKDWFDSAIKADSGVGEEKFRKEEVPISTFADEIRKKYGDI